MTSLLAPLPDGVRGGFTTRATGNLADYVGDDPAHVAARREAVQAELGAQRLVFARQVHGTHIAVVEDSDEDIGEADGLVATTPGVAVGVLVADCLPVLLADPGAGVVAAAHAGRRGLATGILANTVAEMVALGARPGRCVAVIGPAICGGCYEVPAAMRDEVAAIVPGTCASTRTGRPALDLVSGAVEQLADAGVGTIRRTEICTLEDDRYFSYRRDGQTGRFAGIVMLTE